jgi:hypothetical protein
VNLQAGYVPFTGNLASVSVHTMILVPLIHVVTLVFAGNGITRTRQMCGTEA